MLTRPRPSSAMLLGIAAIALVVIAMPQISRAQAPERAADLASPVGTLSHDPAEFALDITAQTTLPIAVGASIALEVPGHVVLRVSAGAVPNAYVDAINDVGTGAGAWEEANARVASTLLSGATVIELALGVRPCGTPGIELSLGYLLLWSHRTVGMSVVGQTGDRTLGLDMSIHALHAELAWQTEIVDHLYFRLAIGWAHGLGHRVALTTESPDEAMRASLAQAASSLSDAVGRHAFGPTLAAALGARF